MIEQHIEPLPPEVAEVYEKAAAAMRKAEEVEARKRAELERERVASWEALLQEILPVFPHWAWGYARIQPDPWPAGQEAREKVHVIIFDISGCVSFFAMVEPTVTGAVWRLRGCYFSGESWRDGLPLEAALVKARERYLAEVVMSELELDA